MVRLFSDLHAHPTLYAFNRMRNDPITESDSEQFHPWQVMASNLKKQDRGERGSTYSQASIPKLAAAGCRLMYASITPIEKGFFDGRLAEGSRSFGLELIKWLTLAVPAVGAVKLARSDKEGALREFASILRNRGPLRQVIQSLVVKYHRRRIKFLMGKEYDYWTEFGLEYEFLRRGDGEEGHAVFELAGSNGTEEREVDGTFHLVKDASQIKSIVEGTDNEVAVILTIEGAHTFSVGPDSKPVPEALVFDRISQLKELPHPLFFITVAHHFDNGICGHAKSIPDAPNLILDQTARMNAGFEREGDFGMRVIRALLGLNKDLTDKAEGRILVDAKHMSARSRREYYDEVVRPYNQSKRDGRPNIPVIFSHAAYSGVSTLQELIDNEGHESDDWHVKGFNGWNLNVADEDVRIVHESGGLIGLVFDQRVLGLKPGEKLSARQYPYLLLRHVFALVDAIMLDDRYSDDEKASVWDCVCLGTDYDGMIDPVSTYPTVLSLPSFADDLANELEKVSHTRQIGKIGVANIVEKICWRNAYDFAMTHLPYSRA